MNLRRDLLWLALVTLAVVAAVSLLPALPQWPDYHAFADQRAWLGIPNFLDVTTSLAFVLVAVAGLRRLLGERRPIFIDARERLPYLLFFAALAGVGFASAWYHLAPDNARLVWDRLFMAVVFMAWLAAILGERLGVGVGRTLLPLLVAAGVASVLYWGWSETRGAGDLRAYALVHFYPMLLLPWLLWRYPARYTRGGDALVVLGLYLAALLMERLDEAIFALGGLVSGHTIKHLLGACAAWWVLRMLVARRPLAGG